MKGNQNANMSREEFNNVQAKQVANTAYNGNELYDKGIVRGKIFVLPEEMRNERVEITLNEGYQFVDENGNVINATKIVLEKKKKEYPKTYEECCEIMNVIMETEIVADAYSERLDDYELNLDTKIENLRKLLICRDAYWKIAGEEIGLGKPWEPDYTDHDQDRYTIANFMGNIEKSKWDYGYSITFAFPTEEMRDAFKENFDKDLEFCKEFL